MGGFDLAAEWMGWENVFHCEWNEFGQKILKHYWPKAISYEDITKTDFTIHRGSIDILTGGFPCQPYSTAGKRKGTADDRHLWPEMLRSIREIQPRYVVGENVRGLTNWNGGLVFDQVQAELEAEGYEVLPFLLPACAINAPHRRDRIWFIANRCSVQRSGTRKEVEQFGARRQTCGDISGNGRERISANPNGTRWKELNIATKSNKTKFNCRNAMYSNSASIKGQHFGQAGERQFNRSNSGIGINGWENFPTQSPICIGDDGLSDKLDGITFSKYRNESIKAAGNAIVPQVAWQLFKAIEQYDKTNIAH